MRNEITSVLHAACLCSAVASAQQSISMFDGFQASRSTAAYAPAVDPGGGASGGGGAATAPGSGTGNGFSATGSGLRSPGSSLLQQDVDYSLRGMFHQAHGDFMLKRERYNPMVEAWARWLPDTTIKHEPGRFDLLDWRGDAEIPAMVSTDGYVVFGAYWEQRRYQFKNMETSPGIPLADETVNGAGVKLGFAWFHDENTHIEVVAMPGVYSDMDGGLHHEDFDYPGRALVTFRTNDDFFLKLGARYNQIFEDAPWLPYIGFGWAIDEQFRLDVLAPEMAEFSWWPDPGVGVLGGIEITGAEYHVRTSAATGNVRDDMQVQEVLVYGGMLFRVGEYASMMGRIGMTVAGDYQLTNGDASLGRVEGSLDPSLFVEFGFGVDF